MQIFKVYGRMVCDIDSSKAFQILKSFKFKKVLDNNYVSIDKIKDHTDEFTVIILK